MSFLYLFDMIEFDENGDICKSTKYDLQKSRSNFLYLISKYNQIFLKEEKLSIPVFFKEKLGILLNEVEKNFDFCEAKKIVLENCVPKVKMIAENVSNDKELISKLNEQVVVVDKNFADKFKHVVNSLQLSYVITSISGKVYEDIYTQILSSQIENDKSSKSKLFKDIITYNSLVSTAEKVKENKITANDFKKMVG